MPTLRMEPDVQNQGYAAGWAAANAAKKGVSVRDVDVKALQAHLVEKKIIDADVPKQTDSFPLSDEAFAQAVRDLADNYKGLGVLMTDPDRARPLLAGAYATAEGEAKFNYAHLLAMLGRDDGAALVLAKFKAMDWDRGWNYRGMGQFNRSVSWADSYAIALGHAKVRAAVPALIEKADKLTEKSEYSHFRAVARALEEIGDKSAAPALARVLKRPGIAGHAQKMQANVPVFEGYSNKAGDWERTLALREICIARALYRLGDTPDGLGRRTLEAYAADPRRAEIPADDPFAYIYTDCFHDVSVEAELGNIGVTDADKAFGQVIHYTQPDEAVEFVRATGIDCLAIAIGTCHGLYPKGYVPELKLDLLRQIRAALDEAGLPVHLVLHGGSNNPDNEIAEAARSGIAKINISSDIKAAYYKKMREVLADEGLREPNAIEPPCIEAMQAVAAQKIDLFGCDGKAALYR